MQLKDINALSFNPDRLHGITQMFVEGEDRKQEAFSELVNEAVRSLEPFVEEKSNGKLRLIRGASNKAIDLLKESELGKVELAKSYLPVAVGLAKKHIEGTTPAFEYVIENLTARGAPEEGDISNAPLFTIARLQVSSRGLGLDPDAHDEVPFEVDEVDGLMLNGKRFGSYSVEDIKSALRKGKTGKAALDFLAEFFGVDAEDTPNGKEQPGTLGRWLKKLEDDFGGSDENEVVMDVKDRLVEVLDEMRDVLADEREKSEAIERSKRKMERHARRLERMQKRGEARESLTVADTAGGETEVD